MLAESHSISDVICATSTSGLTFLPAGTLCDTFSELLVSPGRFERLQKAFDDYDLVVIDSPPVLLSNEPGIWARHLDAVLMVLRANSSSREDAVAAKERLSRMGARNYRRGVERSRSPQHALRPLRVCVQQRLRVTRTSTSTPSIDHMSTPDSVIRRRRAVRTAAGQAHGEGSADAPRQRNRP